MNRYKQLDQIIARLAGMDGLVARLALEITHSVRELTVRMNDLERELTLVKSLAPTLLTRPGIAVLTAAKILGESADITRFKSKDAYARIPAPDRYRCGQATGNGTAWLVPATDN